MLQEIWSTPTNEMIHKKDIVLLICEISVWRKQAVFWAKFVGLLLLKTYGCNFDQEFGEVA